MTELIKIVGIGFSGGMLALVLRRERPEFAAVCALITSALILWSVIAQISAVIGSLRQLIESCGVDINYFIICIKAAGMAYLAQFAAEILRDSGEGAIASKVETAGKIGILVLTLPVMRSLIEMCVKVVNAI